MNIKRISIIGNTASGKSTLSVELSKKLGLPVFHLDKYLWNPGWVRVSEEDFTKSHNKILNKDKWIIDGVAYFSTVEKRFEFSDLIINFDINPEICKKRALVRMKEEKIRPNPFTNGCPYNETEENIISQNDVIDKFSEYKLQLDPLINRYKMIKKFYFVEGDIETKKLSNLILKKIELF